MPKFTTGNKVAAKSPDEKRIMQSLRLNPETIAKLRQYATEHEISMAQAVDLAVSRL